MEILILAAIALFAFSRSSYAGNANNIQRVPLGGGAGVGSPSPVSISVSGNPSPSGYDPGALGTLGQLDSLASTGVAATGTIGSVAAGGSAAFAGTALGAAVPIVGGILAVGGAILGVISAHHREAVAREASGLNEAVPKVFQRFVLIIQAASAREITTQAQAQTLIQQTIDDYYAMVKSIIQGRWPYVQQITNGVGKDVSGPRPGTCNGPCTVGHTYIETGALTTGQTVASILAGGHGTAVLGPIPAHAGFSGMAQITFKF